MKDKLSCSPEVLAPMMVVGYPTYSEYRDGAVDLFKPSTLQGGYKYKRDYRYSNGAVFSSFHNIKYDGDAHKLEGMFTTSDFPKASFTHPWNIKDLLEIFVPHLPGMVKSLMAVDWTDEDERLNGTIQSEYFFNHNETLPSIHLRHIKFDNEHNEQGYTQNEKITVMKATDFDFGKPHDQFAI